MFVYYYVFSSVFLVVNPCGTNPCFNGGTCAQSTSDCNQYVCLCPACYTGQTCSTCKIQTDKMKWLYLWLGWLHVYLVISPDFKRCVILTLWVHQVFCIQTYIKKWGNALMALGYTCIWNIDVFKLSSPPQSSWSSFGEIIQNIGFYIIFTITFLEIWYFCIKRV